MGALAYSGQGEGGVQIWAKSVAAEASVTLHQPELGHGFSWGSCPWIIGPWQSQTTQASRRGGVDSDLCLHTGFLLAAASALASHAHLWCPR